MIYAGTGHRPDKLGGYNPGARAKLGAFALKTLEELAPTKVISGMALGWDTALADAALGLKIPLIAAVPFKGQELVWRPEDQERYRAILAQAEKVEIVCPGGYTLIKMRARNRWMVDHADTVLALWNGDPQGGTAQCLGYAAHAKKPVVNVWEKWRAF